MKFKKPKGYCLIQPEKYCSRLPRNYPKVSFRNYFHYATCIICEIKSMKVHSMSFLAILTQLSLRNKLSNLTNGIIIIGPMYYKGQPSSTNALAVILVTRT